MQKGELKTDTIKQKIDKSTQGIDTPQKIYDLFKELQYPPDKILNTSYKRRIEEFDFAKEEKEKIREIYTVFSYDGDLNIFLIETKSLDNRLIKYITKIFSNRYNMFLLILTIDFSEMVFVFPDIKPVEAGKLKLKITKLIIRKDELYYTDIETIVNLRLTGLETDRMEIFKVWQTAFSVERVTEEFFNDYVGIFDKLRNKFLLQNMNKKEAHEYSLQLLNRIMFIYFVSKKRWLKPDEPRFMKWFWGKYKEQKRKGAIESNTFYEKWLKVLFFEAFNNLFSGKDYFPDELNKIFYVTPFLNGGLFNENDLDKCFVEIEDDFFDDIFEFFEKYNFTIREDLPLYLEVAVDPQMIGYVYESLANVAEEIYERRDLGIFYTPRVEVDFMAKRALVEYLSKNLTDIPKEKLYELVFEEKDTEHYRDKIEKYFSEKGLWPKLEEVLEDLSVVDPACGSGAFLVGMLNILAELYKIIYKHIGREWNDYRVKKRIIGRSLYGVDVMFWAVQAAELRLWLQLVIETDIELKDRRKEPLLPNLNINLRVGDSLVQEIGGLNLDIRNTALSDKLKKKLEDLKQEKIKYYNSESTAKFAKREELINEESKIFEEIVTERIEKLEEQIKNIEKKIHQLTKPIQTDIYGNDIKEPQETLVKKEEALKRNLGKIQEELSKLRILLPKIQKRENKLFVWDIDFAEIFAKGGFDIVIGNPPYVRQKKISPPNKLKEDVTLEDRKEYKDKLIKATKTHFSVIKNIDRNSDYYIYFYFAGLSLLNERGIFCFITSNSWLDVSYGKGLQEFLLKYVPIHAIYDNQSRRSFTHADVNTIIALFGAPKIRERDIYGFRNNEWTALKNTAKFVMFKKPFEEALNTKNLIDIEKIKVGTKGGEITELVKNVVRTNDYRVFPIIQEDLLENSWEYPEDYDRKKGRFKAGSYEGNKWGGKYLRAPEIFYVILEKGKGNLVELGKISKVRRGFTTGVNEFFYFPNKNFRLFEKNDYFILIPEKEGLPTDMKIEKDFLKPIVKSPRECKSLTVNLKDVKYKVLICHMSKEELGRTHALKYIEWGEEKGFHKVATCRGRQPWWNLGIWEYPDMIWSDAYNDRYATFKVPHRHYADKRFFYIYPENDRLFGITRIYLNSIVTPLFIETDGIANLGEGVIYTNVYWLKKLPVLYDIEGNFPIEPFEHKKVISVFTELGINPEKPIREQEPNPLPDRKELDNIVFDILGLTPEERKEVYWAVCELVKNRLEKAKSLKR